MSTLVVGLSHKSAPVATLERTVISGDDLDKLRSDVFHAELRVAGDLHRFHLQPHGTLRRRGQVPRRTVARLGELLAGGTAAYRWPTSPRTCTCTTRTGARPAPAVGGQRPGLDGGGREPDTSSARSGEALGLAREQDTLGRELGEPRPSWRCAPASGRTPRPVSTGPGPTWSASAWSWPAARLAAAEGLDGLRVLVVGAGSMSTLAAVTASRLRPARLVIANRTLKRPLNGWRIRRGVASAALNKPPPTSWKPRTW